MDSKWSKSLDISNTALNEQHIELFNRIITLKHAIDNHAEYKTMCKAIAEVIGYGAYHFTEEEKYFDSIGYKLKSEHKKEHEEIKRNIVSLLENYKKGTLDLTDELIDEVWDSVKKHILEFDMKY